MERFNLKRSENYKITLRGKGTLAVFSRMFSIGENVEMWSILVAISQDKAAGSNMLETGESEEHDGGDL